MFRLSELLKERVSSKVLGVDKLENKLLKYLKRKYNELGEDYIEERTKVTSGAVGDSLEAYIPTKVFGEENWNKFFKKFGYYIGHVWEDGMDFPDEWGEWNTKLQLFPYETQKVEKITDRIYHVTPKNKLLKIKRKGLSPRRSKKTFDIDDPRIYFAKNTQMGRRQIHTLIKNLKKHIEEKPPFGNDVVLLTVDPSKTDVEFYTDPEIGTQPDTEEDWSIYTRENIPPSAIINWEDFDEELEVLRKREK